MVERFLGVVLARRLRLPLDLLRLRWRSSPWSPWSSPWSPWSVARGPTPATGCASWPWMGPPAAAGPTAPIPAPAPAPASIERQE